MGVAAGLDMHPSAPIGIGFVTGVISVLGYKYLTPFLSRFGIQDICGIHNLHGMPGVLGSMVAMWATLGLSYDSNEYEELFPRGRGQAGIQAAATAISIRTRHSHSLLGELLHLLVSTHLVLLHRRRLLYLQCLA
jgi:ammonium transporter Rh